MDSEGSSRRSSACSTTSGFGGIDTCGLEDEQVDITIIFGAVLASLITMFRKVQSFQTCTVGKKRQNLTCKITIAGRIKLSTAENHAF
jgi:hypothetical protein